jgi:hypothetical protein
MRNVLSGMLSVAVVFGASSAWAQEFGSKGTPAISADRLAGFSIDHSKQTNPAPGVDTKVTSNHLGFLWQGGGADSANGVAQPYSIPRLAFDYFVIDRLSIGGALGYASYSVDVETRNTVHTSLSAFVFAPRVGYVWNLNGWASFWLRGGFTYHSFSTDANAGSEHAIALTVEPTFVLSPSNHWGFVVGPTADFSFSGSREVGNGANGHIDRDLSYTSFGILRAGMIGWF